MSTTYLENQVLAATPQKLRLMLIEGAIRFARAAQAHWNKSEPDAARDALLRCQAVIGELVRSVRAEPADCERFVDGLRRQRPLTAQQRSEEINRLTEIGRNTTAVYLIVLRDLNELLLEQSSAKMNAIVRVLEIERETAELLCEKQPEAPVLDLPPGEEISSTQAAHILDAGAPPAASFSTSATYGNTPHAKRSSLSLDA